MGTNPSTVTTSTNLNTAMIAITNPMADTLTILHLPTEQITLSTCHKVTVDTTSMEVETTSTVVDTNNTVVETNNMVVDTNNTVVETKNTVVKTNNTVVDTNNMVVETAITNVFTNEIT